jgi:enoyl-CoA hydratase
VAVRSEREGPVAVVTIDRPEVRNAVDRPTADALEAALVEADADADVHAIVLTGAGGTFCAGADLGAVEEQGAGGRRNRLERSDHGPMGPTRRVLAAPVIAAVEGHAVAGGLELACWADLRVVAEDAVLGVFCRRWGVPLIDGGTVRLPRLVGLGRALDLILTGRAVTADEAHRIGLADRVVPAGTTRDAAVALGRELAAFPQAALLADLASARSAFDRDLPAALLAEHDRGVAALDDPETIAGVARFVGGAGRGGAPAR